MATKIRIINGIIALIILLVGLGLMIYSKIFMISKKENNNNYNSNEFIAGVILSVIGLVYVMIVFDINLTFINF